MNRENEKTILIMYNQFLQSHDEKEHCKFDYFRAGFNAHIAVLESEKALKEKRKNFVFEPELFIDDSCDKDFINCVHYENKCVIVTNAQYLLEVSQEYDADKENKSYNRDGSENDGRYPNYKKVIPDSKDMIETDLFSRDDLKILMKCEKSKSPNKQKACFIAVNSDYSFTYFMLKKVLLFWNMFPAAKLYKHSEDDAHRNSFYLKDNENIFVFMPLVKCYSSEVSQAHIIYNKADKIYTDLRTETE